MSWVGDFSVVSWAGGFSVVSWVGGFSVVSWAGGFPVVSRAGGFSVVVGWRFFQYFEIHRFPLPKPSHLTVYRGDSVEILVLGHWKHY